MTGKKPIPLPTEAVPVSFDTELAAQDAATAEIDAIVEWGQPPEGFRWDPSRTEPLPDGRRHPVAVPDTRRQREGGNPSHRPTATSRALVRQLKFLGNSLEKIAEAVKISPETLKRHYADDLEIGTTRMKQKIIRRGLDVAMGEPWNDRRGKSHQGPPDTKLLDRFLTVAGVPEAKKRVELTGPENGPVQISAVQQFRDRIRNMKVLPPSAPPLLPSHGDSAPSAERDVGSGEVEALAGG